MIHLPSPYCGCSRQVRPPSRCAVTRPAHACPLSSTQPRRRPTANPSMRAHRDVDELRRLQALDETDHRQVVGALLHGPFARVGHLARSVHRRQQPALQLRHWYDCVAGREAANTTATRARREHERARRQTERAPSRCRQALRRRSWSQHNTHRLRTKGRVWGQEALLLTHVTDAKTTHRPASPAPPARPSRVPRAAFGSKSSPRACAKFIVLAPRRWRRITMLSRRVGLSARPAAASARLRSLSVAAAAKGFGANPKAPPAKSKVLQTCTCGSKAVYRVRRQCASGMHAWMHRAQRRGALVLHA
eukprot:363865-Chlamydomonas_euryale.AAC.9